MANRRKSAEILELSGAFAKNPSRRRSKAPEHPESLGPPPDRLGKPERAIWNELAGAAPPGVLRASDYFAVELAVYLIMKARKGEAKAGEISILRLLLNDLGMTAAGRQRLSVPEDPQRNKFEDL